MPKHAHYGYILSRLDYGFSFRYPHQWWQVVDKHEHVFPDGDNDVCFIALPIPFEFAEPVYGSCASVDIVHPN